MAVCDETEDACPFVGCFVEQVPGCSERARRCFFTANAIRVPGTTWNERDRNSRLSRKNTPIRVPTFFQRHSVAEGPVQGIPAIVPMPNDVLLRPWV